MNFDIEIEPILGKVSGITDDLQHHTSCSKMGESALLLLGSEEGEPSVGANLKF